MAMAMDGAVDTAVDAARGRDIEAGITFLYYRDLAAAHAFYRDVLGLRLARDQGWCKIMALTPSAYVGLVDETRGSLRATADKPVMLTLVVANVDAWHARLAAAGVAGLTQPKLHEDIGIYGFFASDPEGYHLEIQSFLRPLS
jgi:lactoylglutathione lyase